MPILGACILLVDPWVATAMVALWETYVVGLSAVVAGGRTGIPRSLENPRLSRELLQSNPG